MPSDKFSVKADQFFEFEKWRRGKCVLYAGRYLTEVDVVDEREEF